MILNKLFKTVSSSNLASKIQNVIKYLSNQQHLANMLIEVLKVCVRGGGLGSF